MSILSIEFFVFLIVLLTIYYKGFYKKQWLLLFCGSLLFYACYNPYFLIFLFFSVGITYYAAIFIENNKSKYGKLCLVLTLCANVGILIVLKYTGFFLETIADILSVFGINYAYPEVNFLLPLGISYYTFMTVGYLADVYWGICESEKNFFKYATFVIYFPHITQGPIDSFANLKEDLFSNHSFELENLKEGVFRIITGLFKKLVIAQRLAVYVDRVYLDPYNYGSLALLMATFFYAIQLYCDFSGYMDMAVGTSRLFGIKIEENFNLPYFSKSIPEYWRRWHITLGVWFRTYIFYPVIRSKFCKNLVKKSSNKRERIITSEITTVIGLVCVWLLTGFWHGASWHYVVHGIYHGTIIIISTIFDSKLKIIRDFLKIHDSSKAYGAFAIIRTFILVDISYIFFRASNMKDAVYILKEIFVRFSINMDSIKNSLLPFTEDNNSVSYFIVVAMAILMLFIYELLQYKGNKFLSSRRYFVSAAMVIMILLFGIFGQSTFIYAAY